MRSITFFLACITACSSQSVPAEPDATTSPDALGPFDPNVDAADVSILYPLTPTTQRDQLVTASELASYGPLLPEHIVPGTPYPLDISTNDAYADLRLVAIRLDPCSARGTCTSEIRAIFQPVVSAHGQVGASDGAIHVFYAVPPDELVAVMKQILALKKAHGADITYPAQLGPQPILVASGLDGEFARGLHAIWLAHLGEQRIQRVTFLLHRFPDQDAWAFVRFEREGLALVATNIVNLSTANQLLLGSTTAADSIGGIEPDLHSTPTLPQLSTLASSQRPAQITSDIATGFAQAIQAEDPRLHNSEDTDCGTCHVAEGARRAGVDVYGLVPSGQFTSPRSLAYIREGKPLTNLHAFGYLGTSISIMQRTANESALVADRMQAAVQ